MVQAPSFSNTFIRNQPVLDPEACQAEMVSVVSRLIGAHPEVDALVLECTNMPPYAEAARKAAGGIPVFDITAMGRARHIIRQASAHNESRKNAIAY
nr:hypothetical protein [uncultured Desulfobacter sp.]